MDDDINNYLINGLDLNDEPPPPPPSANEAAPPPYSVLLNKNPPNPLINQLPAVPKDAQALLLEKRKLQADRVSNLRLQGETEALNKKRTEDYLDRRKRHKLITKECARRRTFTPQTHESRVPKAENSEIEKELQSLPFNDGWRSVFAAFGVEEAGDPIIKAQRCDEDFNSYVSSIRESHISESMVRDYLLTVLDGAPVSDSFRPMLSHPLDQYDPDPQLRVSNFALGRVVKAVPFIFESYMSSIMDDFAVRRRGEPLTDMDWQRLLNTAKADVEAYLELQKAWVLFRYPKLKISELESVVSEVIANTVLPLFAKALPLFYYQVYGVKDRLIAGRCLLISKNKNLLDIASRFGLDANAPSHVIDNEEEIVYWFHQGLNETERIPRKILADLVAGAQLLGKVFGNRSVGGDAFLPLFIAAVVLSVTDSTKVCSLAHLLEDFGLKRNSGGEEDFVCSMLFTSLEVLLKELT